MLSIIPLVVAISFFIRITGTGSSNSQRSSEGSRQSRTTFSGTRGRWATITTASPIPRSWGRRGIIYLL